MYLYCETAVIVAPSSIWIYFCQTSRKQCSLIRLEEMEIVNGGFAINNTAKVYVPLPFYDVIDHSEMLSLQVLTLCVLRGFDYHSRVELHPKCLYVSKRQHPLVYWSLWPAKQKEMYDYFYPISQKKAKQKSFCWEVCLQASSKELNHLKSLKREN